MSNNNPKPSNQIRNNRDYAYHDKFIAEISKMLSKPILDELERRKQSKQSFVNEMRDNGLNYNYRGFVNSLRGNNPYVTNYNYFSKVYEYLELPIPTIDYLSSFK